MYFDLTELIDQMKNKNKLDVLSSKHQPTLTIFKSSDDYASEKYINNKIKACQNAGVWVNVQDISEMTTQRAVEKIKNCTTNGIIVQLPTNENLNSLSLINSVPYEKDVDGFSYKISGQILLNGKPTFPPCTAAACIDIIKYWNEKINNSQSLAGLNIVIINRSTIVGKPLSLMLTALDATVTVCHSKTNNIKEYLAIADVVVTAVGIPNFIHPTDVKEGCLVVDVSINRSDEGKVIGDCSVDFATANNVYSTKVPGGVGPLTVQNLIKNTITANNIFNVR